MQVPVLTFHYRRRHVTYMLFFLGLLFMGFRCGETAFEVFFGGRQLRVFIGSDGGSTRANGSMMVFTIQTSSGGLVG